MEIEYYGANCIKIETKKTSIVIDDNLVSLGQKGVATAKDIVLVTGAASELPAEARFTLDQPGEYEISDVSIQGIPAQSHMDEPGKSSTTIYRIIMDGVRIVVTGHINPDLSDVQLEAIGTVDILFLPIGGNGYTLDGIGAQKVLKEIEPRIVVPTHYDDPKLKYEVPQAPLEEAIKALGMEVTETLDSIKMKNFDLGEGTKLVVLNRQ